MVSTAINSQKTFDNQGERKEIARSYKKQGEGVQSEKEKKGGRSDEPNTMKRTVEIFYNFAIFFQFLNYDECTISRITYIGRFVTAMCNN